MYRTGPELRLRDANENLRSKLSMDKGGPKLTLLCSGDTSAV
jgi:hypothetical protein